MHATKQFAEFCESDALLFPLRFTQKEAAKRCTELRRLPITSVQPGDTFYLNLRYYGTAWYDQLDLPESTTVRYAVPARYEDWRRTSGQRQRKITVSIPLFGETLVPWDNLLVFLHGSYFELTDNMRVVDREFAIQHPLILPEASREALLDVFKAAAPGGGGRGNVAACAYTTA